MCHLWPLIERLAKKGNEIAKRLVNNTTPVVDRPVIYAFSEHMRVFFAALCIAHSLASRQMYMPAIDYILCRFHVSNHVCPRCKTKYNPYTHKCTDNMNTEVCEQTFRWWGRMAGMLNSMTPNRFKFTTYHLINDHNKRLVSIWKSKGKLKN